MAHWHFESQPENLKLNLSRLSDEMKRHRKTWIFLIIVVTIIQFIQPKKNISIPLAESDISRVYSIPVEIHRMLTEKCYDCHSNHTKYPWYFNIQPIGWWFAANIYKGKLHLNFSEFKNYQSDKARLQLEAIIEKISDRAMPFKGLVLLHPYREITEDDEKAIHAWATALMTSHN
jgi:hypothetical protein